MLCVKKKEYQLQIDTPCEESWNSMINNETGKFCLHCSKNVTDFTTLSDQQIIQIIRESKEKRCGSFHPEQLNRLLVADKPVSSFSHYYKIAAGFLLLIASQAVNAQGKRLEYKNNMEVAPVKANPASKTNSVKHSSSSKLIVRGKVLDSLRSEAIPFATVFIKNANKSVQTDTNGYFQLSIPKASIKGAITLVVTCYGYNNREFIINKNSPSAVKSFYLSEHAVITVEAKAVSHERTSGAYALKTEEDKSDQQKSGQKKWWRFWK